MNKLLNIAYKEIQKLEDCQNPTWETYSQIADLSASIAFLERRVNIESNSMSELLDDLRENLGAERTLDILELTLSNFCKDLNCISPQLTSVLIKRIKEQSVK